MAWRLFCGRVFFCSKFRMDDKKPRQLDWERIGAEYRAGKLSLREIGRQHGCSEGAIRKRAKAEGWERDLQARVDEAVRNKLVRAEVRISAATEKEVVDAAAAASVHVVLSHRKDIAKLRELEERFIDELGGEGAEQPKKLFITQYQGKVVQEEVGLTVTEKASTLQSLAMVRFKRIEIERKVFNIDGERERTPGEALDNILQDIMRGNATRIPLPSEERGEG